MLTIRPALRLEHRPGDGLGHVERPEEVRLEDLAPGLDAHPHDQVVAGDPGVVDEDVDLAEGLERRLDDGLRGLGLLDVGLDRERLASERLDRRDRLAGGAASLPR